MIESMSESEAKEQAKDRDGWECRFCGVSNEQHKQEYGRGLHAHHIIKDGDGGADHPRNLITVCRDCHNTLEKTQARALSRIKEEHTTQTKEEYEERISELEADLREERNKTNEVFAWFKQHSVRVHILVKGVISPDVELYEDREEAAQEYTEYDGAAEMFSRKVEFEDVANETLRFLSTGNTSVNMTEYGSSYFKSGQEPNLGFMEQDIPKELLNKDAIPEVTEQ